jgi:hypothetical protein
VTPHAAAVTRILFSIHTTMPDNPAVLLIPSSLHDAMQSAWLPWLAVLRRAIDFVGVSVATPLLSDNPLRIALNGWVHLARDLRRARGWRATAWVLLGPPTSSPTAPSSS